MTGAQAGMVRQHARLRLLLHEVALVVAGVLVYFGVRGMTAGSRAAALDNARSLVEIEQRLGMRLEDEVQDLVLGWEPAVTLANWAYIWGHWPVIAAVLVWLFLSRPEAYREVRGALLLSGAVGLVVFAGFPVAPPRLADPGIIDTVTEQSRSYRVLQPNALVNQYAALPSLHVGWDLLMGIAIVANARHAAVRAVGMLLPPVMVVAVVVTGNHYLLDGVAGAALVLASLAVVRGLRRLPEDADDGSRPPDVLVPRQRRATESHERERAAGR